MRPVQHTLWLAALLCSAPAVLAQSVPSSAAGQDPVRMAAQSAAPPAGMVIEPASAADSRINVSGPSASQNPLPLTDGRHDQSCRPLFHLST